MTRAVSPAADRRHHAALVGILLGVILASAFALRLYDLAGQDMAGDDVLYSFRAIGYLDYVASANLQSTPMTWFSEPQWWQRLSFHDHPPLVFLVQWLFFKIGGVNLWSARLPFALAGTLSVLFVFLLGRRMFGAGAGLLAAGALAVANYAVWISRIGLLDGFLVLEVILAMYFFVRAGTAPVHYVWWSAAVAAGVLTKYTFLFMLPVFLLLLFCWRRAAFRAWQFYLGIAILLALLSPLAVYNAMMWQARGHPDAALSTMIGQHPEDFKGLARDVKGGLDIFSGTKRVVADNFSIGFQLMAVFGLIFLFVGAYRHSAPRGHAAAVLIGLLFAMIMLALVGGGDRFGVILLPFLILAVGFSALRLYQCFSSWGRMACITVLALLAAWELFFSIQSQLMARPVLDHRLARSINGPSRGGYNQLEAYVGKFYQAFAGRPAANLYTEAPQLARYQDAVIRRLSEERSGLPPFQHLLVHDDRLAWFQSVWIFERRSLYEAAPIHSLSQFIETLQARGVGFYTRFGLQDVTIITPAGGVPQNPLVRDRAAIQDFMAELEKSIKPFDEIRGPGGEVMFRVFKLPLI